MPEVAGSNPAVRTIFSEKSVSRPESVMHVGLAGLPATICAKRP
jgi:hypothetical protein